MRQADAQSSDLPSRQKPVQVLMDAELWERFDTVSRAQNRTRSAQVRELIERDIKAYDERQAATA